MQRTNNNIPSFQVVPLFRRHLGGDVVPLGVDFLRNRPPHQKKKSNLSESRPHTHTHTHTHREKKPWVFLPYNIGKYPSFDTLKPPDKAFLWLIL
jgi:hypothetical protein